MRRIVPLLLLLACGGDKSDPADDDDDVGGTDDTSEDAADDTGSDTDQPVDADGDGFAEPEDCNDTDATVFPGADELCDGVDQDCDGVVDNDPVDGEAVWTDADGDGYGDPDTAAMVCERDSAHVDNSQDCDDTDADTHPGAVEFEDGHDDDCDELVDEAAAVVVVGYQCQVHAADSWADEVGAIHSYLADLGLRADELNEDPESSDDDAFVAAYDIALFSKCGWAWQTYNQDMLDSLLDARAKGTAVFAFDDDISYHQYNVSGSEDLVFLEDAPVNGTKGQTAEFDSTSTHPAYAGPHGTPTDFVYAWDIDQTTATGDGEQVLGTHSGSYPWWLVYEDSTTGVRSSTLGVNLYSANEGSIGSDARDQVEIVFKNVVTWLLQI